MNKKYDFRIFITSIILIILCCILIFNEKNNYNNVTQNDSIAFKENIIYVAVKENYDLFNNIQIINNFNNK